MIRTALAAWLGAALVATPSSTTRAQGASPAATTPAQWRAWAFGRIGPSQTDKPDRPIFALLSGGVAASHGAILGMIRASDNEDPSFRDSQTPGMQDYAVLAGARSRGDRLFIAGAAGVARSTPADVFSATGTPLSSQLAPAFDISAHADYRVAGLALNLSGALGPPRTRYVALSLGAELGWFGL
jgi:hypothetical protein